MLFQNFKYEASKPMLENGEYKATIIKAEEKYYQNSGDAYVWVTVRIEGHPDATPNILTVNDIPQIGARKANGNAITEEDVKRANRAVSRFLDCFSLSPSYLQNIQSWLGHSGIVKVNWQYDPNESDKKSKKYKELTPVVPEKAQNQIAGQSPNINTAFQTEQATTENTTGKGFKEDFPIY